MSYDYGVTMGVVVIIVLKHDWSINVKVTDEYWSFGRVAFNLIV